MPGRKTISKRGTVPARRPMQSAMPATQRSLGLRMPENQTVNGRKAEPWEREFLVQARLAARLAETRAMS